MPFIGLATGILIALGGLGFGRLLLSILTDGLNDSCRLALHGALGLGFMGLFMFLTGLASTVAAVTLGIICVVVGLVCLCWHRPKVGVPPEGRMFLLVMGLFFLIRLPAALTPSDASDWDSISHQMAMAKLWLAHGRIDFIPFMHQSNIPGTVNTLYMLALSVMHQIGFTEGGQFAAKTVAFAFAVFAAMGVGGLAGMRYGGRAGWWAALALMVTPVVLSEVGTAYVDIAHGLFTGMAILLAVMAWTDSSWRLWILAGLCLGFSMGTKYTGIQAAGAVGIVMAACCLLHRPKSGNGKAVLAAIALAVLIAAPWYIRNYVNTGNPVYPFFYSVFGGRNWSQENAAAYSEEQRSFGIGQRYADEGAYRGKDPKAFPGSVTALALLPDKQINQGTPWGAIGPLFLLGLLWWPLAGRRTSAAASLPLLPGAKREEEGAGGWRSAQQSGAAQESLIILIVLVSLISWFYLTQQSRYIIGLMVPAAFLLGGAVERARWGWLAATGIGLQAAYSMWLFAYPGISPLQDQIRYLTAPDTAEYLNGRFPFWEATQDLNGLAKENKVNVALFDEPRGFYLDVDYFWANPGHSTMIDYSKVHTPEDLIIALKGLGTTHVYMNFAFLGEQGQILRSLFFSPLPRRSRISDSDYVKIQEFRKLLLEAWEHGLLKEVKSYDVPANGVPRAFLFEVVK